QLSRGVSGCRAGLYRAEAIRARRQGREPVSGGGRVYERMSAYMQSNERRPLPRMRYLPARMTPRSSAVGLALIGVATSGPCGEKHDTNPRRCAEERGSLRESPSLLLCTDVRTLERTVRARMSGPPHAPKPPQFRTCWHPAASAGTALDEAKPPSGARADLLQPPA